jgi:hypothetical protein
VRALALGLDPLGDEAAARGPAEVAHANHNALRPMFALTRRTRLMSSFTKSGRTSMMWPTWARADNKRGWLLVRLARRCAKSDSAPIVGASQRRPTIRQGMSVSSSRR